MRIISLYRHAMFVNPAICWWILGISRFGYWKERCNKISCISLPVYIFLFFLCKYLGIKWLHYLVSVYLTLINQEVFFLSSVQFSSVAQSCLTLCDPMDCSTPGFPVHHQLLELTQTHVHWVSDAIQPSHPLLSPSPPAFNLSWHQGLFKWVSSSHQVAKIIGIQLQHQSFHWIFRTDFLEDRLVGSPCSPRDSQESSLAPQFEASIL